MTTAQQNPASGAAATKTACLCGYDACFFCLGVSPAGMSEAAHGAPKRVLEARDLLALGAA